MKTTYIIIVMLFTFSLAAQELPEGFNRTLGGRIEAETMLQGNDFNQLVKWTSLNYDARNVFLSEGLIIIQASTALTESPRPIIGDDDNRLYYNIELWTEGDKTRVVISNIKNYSFSGGSEPLTPIEKWDKVRNNGEYPKRFQNTLDNVQRILDNVSNDLSSYL